ncbi:type II toxin-antitoxin system TacA family antitoxin [Agromyces mangrovi Wang et al. 2018]|uniref:type II toxin-antitoxin system TacA family antitoxin n=1 Tax=Agromyces mangrovi TaxID=1858653 RepID=UPI00257452A4|nr:DUF1778 domain-containing protein [Agromyces mangrovi]BDZ63281.1 hypothetical protein GCM10025877_02190 [Agromyces mangrovi]
MPAAAKNQRLELRLTQEQKAAIEQAAQLSGRTVTDFSVSFLVEQAREVIRAEHELRMSDLAWSEFSTLLERPAQPVQQLAELLQRPSVFVD